MGGGGGGGGGGGCWVPQMDIAVAIENVVIMVPPR